MENDASGMSYLKQLRIWLPKWCDAFLPCTFLGRRNTTSINESQHARLKRTLNAASTLVDCLDAIWSCKDSEDVSLPKLRPLTWDLGHGRSISPLAAHILDKEIQAELHMLPSNQNKASMQARRCCPCTAAIAVKYYQCVSSVLVWKPQ
eukprot:TRINITY_DN1033_c2_g1_i17.p1 TRINITY_DN1033_c2_g1~~TRINITY_DN1033_c2_g1_i17.p1  ORF type:complete len:156 (-),score=19.60 TRINITY_DN1033_c2_g1_i17:376-822(-)